MTSRVSKVAFVSVLFASLTLSVPSAQASASSERRVSVIVREMDGAGGAPEAAVRHAGGRVTRHIRVIRGFVATMPASQVAGLRATTGVRSVTLDTEIKLMNHGGSYQPVGDPGSIYDTTRAIKAPKLWSAGITGEGVDIALIDSGVVPVDGLATTGKIINGPDLSWESQADNLRYLDTFGHGTHMAGLMAGRENGMPDNPASSNHHFAGVAPDARILNVKVADSHGTTDVSQVIAAIDWVIQHRNTDGLNVRVINLSFGTDGVQTYRLDPLAHAAEVAWHKGIVVVVSAGNTGFGDPQLNNPAYDPYVLAVGASDTKGTNTTDDDEVPGWSASGESPRTVDVVAPGKSVVSLRDPGSYVDITYPEGRVGTNYFRGSGTSQAAAVVSGAAALLIQDRPGLTPDQVKGLLRDTATYLPQGGAGQGSGLINLQAAHNALPPIAPQTHPRSLGIGSLELARGSQHVEANGVTLAGEVDIFGWPWLGATWAADVQTGNTWIDGIWNGGQWTGNSWSGMSPMGASWGSVEWDRNQWSGDLWARNQWSDDEWARNQWSGEGWTRNQWSNDAWARNQWSNDNWDG